MLPILCTLLLGMSVACYGGIMPWTWFDTAEQAPVAHNKKRYNRPQKRENNQQKIDIKKTDSSIIEWKKNELKHDVRVSDVYLQQAAPFYELHSQGATKINIESTYSYACTANNSAGVQGSMLELMLGQPSVLVNDLLLASKLAQYGVITQDSAKLGLVDGFDSNEVGNNYTLPGADGYAQSNISNQYLVYLASNPVFFRGVSHRVDNAIAITHKLGYANLSIGMRVPLVYAKHRAKASMRFNSAATNYQAAIFGNNKPMDAGVYSINAQNGSNRLWQGFEGDVAAAIAATNLLSTPPVSAALTELKTALQNDTQGDNTINIGSMVGPNTFMRRYGQNPALFLDDIFYAKGMPEMGGSSFGIGDIQISLTKDLAMHGVEHAVAGIKITIPTAQHVTTNKFWAPELGNGGHAALGFFASVLVAHNQWLNPHGAIDCDVFGSAHVNARAPKRIQCTNKSTSDRVLTDLMSFGERVYLSYPENSEGLPTSFDTYDTSFAGIGDNVGSFIRSRGTAFHARVGNLMTSTLYGKLSTDLYYDLAIKLKDTFTDKLGQWNTLPLAAYSQSVAHTIGVMFAYQVDSFSRASFGASHVLLGTNTPRHWNFSALLEFTF